MPSINVTALISVALLLAACASAKDRYVENGYRLLSGAETRDLVSGKTVEGRYMNRVGLWTDFHSPDGRVGSREGDGDHVGTWEIRGDEICYTYPDEHPELSAPLPNCEWVAEKNGRYVHFLANGPKRGDLGGQWMNITPGNPKNLPLN